jgi:hypothetical protein
MERAQLAQENRVVGGGALGIGYRHIVGPVVRDSSGRRIVRRRPTTNATVRRARIVVAVVGQRVLYRDVPCSGFAGASHDGSLAPNLS